ncbi:MAG: GNAT family N-acetyltransferase [Propionibacteriales bacterium]|nr:GNAT family N-acetyltransferase [Propionibacteriales bacterium]
MTVADFGLHRLNDELAAVVCSWAQTPAEVAMFAGESLSPPLTATQFARVVGEQDRQAWVLLLAGVPVAMGSVQFRGESARLGWVLTDPSRRGFGYGRRMVTALLAQACADPQVRRITLGVYRDNTAARALYADLGFVDTGARRYTEVNQERWESLDLELVLPVQLGSLEQ